MHVSNFIFIYLFIHSFIYLFIYLFFLIILMYQHHLKWVYDDDSCNGKQTDRNIISATSLARRKEVIGLISSNGAIHTWIYCLHSAAEGHINASDMPFFSIYVNFTQWVYPLYITLILYSFWWRVMQHLGNKCAADL